MSQPRKSTRKKRQTQLSFSPLPSSSPAVTQYPEQIQRRAAAVRYDSDMSPTKKRRVANYSTYKLPFSPVSSDEKHKVQVVIPSPSKNPEQLPTPAASSQVREENADNSENDAPRIGQPKAHANGANGGMPVFGGTTKALEGTSTIESTSEEDITPIRSARRARAAPVTLSYEEGSDSQVAPMPVTPKLQSRTHRTLPILASSPSSEGDIASPKRLLRQKLSVSTTSQPNAIQSTPQRSRLERHNTKETPQPLIISSGNEEDSSEDDIITPARRRRSTANIETTPQSELSKAEDVQDLDADVADLSDTVLRKTRTRGRQDASERCKRQRKLEELRQRRAGIRAESDDDEEEEYAEDDSEESGYEPIQYAMRRGGDLDKYEDDFLDDENDTVGVDLGVAGVPLEFTYHANKKPFGHFKAEVEWMVHNKLNPAFDRHDEIYLLAHDKLDKEVEQFGSAKFSSSVWKEPFVKALKSRPDFYRVEVPTMFERKCDACQRSNHPPKHRVTFTGKPYDRDTLETIHYKDDDDDSEEDDSHETSDSDDDKEEFLLGRFCCANAEMAHALHHWRYSLNQTVLQWLAADGQLTPEKIVERANMRQKKQAKASNKVVDSMEARGVMKQLYKQFKENLEAARNAKPHHFSNSH